MTTLKRDLEILEKDYEKGRYTYLEYKDTIKSFKTIDTFNKSVNEVMNTHNMPRDSRFPEAEWDTKVKTNKLIKKLIIKFLDNPHQDNSYLCSNDIERLLKDIHEFTRIFDDFRSDREILFIISTFSSYFAMAYAGITLHNNH